MPSDAPPQNASPENAAEPPLVFLDVETTGTRTTRDRIIELAALKVQNERIIDRWEQPFDPGMRIPDAVTRLTGIDNAMLEGAACLDEVAAPLASWLEGCTLVAHNVRFDYAFLRNAFKRAGLRFNATRLICTLRLSRRLAPHAREHNLPAVLQRHAIRPGTAHRAADDAAALWALWQQWRADHAAADWQALLDSERQRQSRPAQLDDDALDNLPATPGVYLFYGHNRLPLYVGKSVNLRQRVLGHFQSDHQNDREMRLARQVQHLEWEETAGDLGAQLREAQLVKALMPILNRQLRKQRRLTAWQWPPGASRPELVQPDRLDNLADTLATAPLYGLFRSPRDARAALADIVDRHRLCPRLMGLESGRGRCFASQLGKCLGACCGKESAEAHAHRARDALLPLQLDTWPWSGRIAIKESHAKSRHSAWHVVRHWCYLGSAESHEEAAELDAEAPAFDMDSYRILSRFLRDPERHGLTVVELDAPPVDCAARTAP